MKNLNSNDLITFLKQKLNSNPNDSSLNYQIGYELHKAKQPKEALYYYKRSIELGNNDVNAYLNLSKALYECGNLKESLELAKRAQNKFPNEKYFGSQIFYSKNHAGSQNLASGIKDSLVGLIQPENTRETKPADKKIFLLHNAQIPAVIVECGFLSNENEANKLTKPEYQTQLAFSIYCGISNYFINNSAEKA